MSLYMSAWLALSLRASVYAHRRISILGLGVTTIRLMGLGKAPWNIIISY